MTARAPYTQAQIRRAIQAVKKEGLPVRSVGVDGTINAISEMEWFRLLYPTGFIYYAQAGKFIKIGFSKSWRERITDLQVASPAELRVVVVYRGCIADEVRAHRQFAEYRERGEWFRHEGALRQYVTLCQHMFGVPR